jgi:phage baseplate assembly protein W
MHIAYPFAITRGGLIATVNYERHIEQLIEQLLFTMPGERVNLPDFGTPVAQLVFNPNSEELVAATQFLIQGALQQWLGQLIQVQAVQVTTEDTTLSVAVSYIIRQTQQQRVSQFTAP